jgi:hypothetical protein
MRGATSTLGPLPCRAAVMRSVIGDSFLKAANATGRRCPFAQASPSPRTKGVLTGHCHGPCDKPERTAQPRLLVREGAAHAGRPGPRACPIQRALAGNLEKRTPGPRACQCRALPWREATARFERHGSDLAARPDVAWGPTADPQGSCGTRPGCGDPSWRCSTAQLRVRPGGSGCATQGEPRGPSSTRRTVLTATDPWDQSNAEPPLTPSPERVPRIAHAALGCAILVQG